MKSLTPSSSRPSTPQLINISPPNRDTLISDESKSSEHLSTSSSSSSTKPSPTISVSSQENGHTTSTKSNHDKAHKIKPEIASKPTKLVVPPIKLSSSPNSNHSPLMARADHTNNHNNNEPTVEAQPVARKSKFSRRKMTEEEAVKELGLFFLCSLDNQSNKSYLLEPIAATDDPIKRFIIKKKLGSGY